MNDYSIKIGLALGGGAVLGAAHLGVLKALEENHLVPSMMTGTSAGASIAAMYGFGMTPEAIRDAVTGVSWWDLSKIAWSKYGLLRSDEMEAFLCKQIGEAEFKDSNIPIAFIAADICSGEKVLLNKGSVAKAAVISSCVPGLFSPYSHDDRLLVDGGLVENVPVSPLQEMGAEFVIGVNLNGAIQRRPPDNIIDVLSNAFDIAIDNHTLTQLSTTDHVIALDLSQFSRTDSSHVTELYDIGYQTCMGQIEEIKAKLEDHKPGIIDLLAQQFKSLSQSLT